ncbi:MAG: hypothetical protein ACXVLQ_01085 [Bacteriovorax sp.]
MKILLSLVPRELGRFIYINIFKIHSFFARIFYGKNVQLWYRNSLLQNYFSFCLSDIDVSAKFSSDQRIIVKSEKMVSFLTLCPLIKEINIYYPFCLGYVPKIANYYELKKDKKLSSQIKRENDFPDAQKFTYLLRMFFSNRNQLKNGLSPRDVQKWIFHFNLIARPDLAQLLGPKMNEKDLLQLIFKTFVAPEPDKENYYQAVWNMAECQLTQKSLFTQFQEAHFPKELFLLVPHQFCFTGFKLHNASPFAEQVFVSQLSWEILGMMNQPALFKKESRHFEHLKNIKRTLNDTHLSDNGCQNKKRELAETIEAFLLFLIVQAREEKSGFKGPI